MPPLQCACQLKLLSQGTVELYPPLAVAVGLSPAAGAGAARQPLPQVTTTSVTSSRRTPRTDTMTPPLSAGERRPGAAGG